MNINGTVLGTDIQDTSTSDYEGTKLQEEKKQEEQGEEEENPTVVSETHLTDSYPQPGQQHQQEVTATPKKNTRKDLG